MMGQKEQSGKMDTHIGQGCSLKGDIKCKGGVRIDGQFEGTLDVQDLLIVGKTGRVKVNDARVKNCILGGSFNGKLFVEGKAELEKGARFDGEIQCKVLIIEEGVIFNGQCLMEDKEKQPREASPPKK